MRFAQYLILNQSVGHFLYDHNPCNSYKKLKLTFNELYHWISGKYGPTTDEVYMFVYFK